MCCEVVIWHNERLSYDDPSIANRAHNLFYDICVHCLGIKSSDFQDGVKGSVETTLRYFDENINVAYTHKTREIVINKTELKYSMGENYTAYEKSIRYVSFLVDCSPGGCGRTEVSFNRKPSELPDSEYYGESETPPSIPTRLS